MSKLNSQDLTVIYDYLVQTFGEPYITPTPYEYYWFREKYSVFFQTQTFHKENVPILPRFVVEEGLAEDAGLRSPGHREPAVFAVVFTDFWDDKLTELMDAIQMASQIVLERTKNDQP